MDRVDVFGLRISWQRESCCAILSLVGEADLANADAIDFIAEGMANSGGEHLIIDCSGLAFIDSTGLHAMMRAAHRFHDQVGLVATTSQTELVIKIAGLYAHLPRYESVEAAQRHFDQGQVLAAKGAHFEPDHRASSLTGGQDVGSQISPARLKMRCGHGS